MLVNSFGIIQNIELYVLLFFIYSFAGWFMESVGGIINVKKFINRGFLIGPYCPVYGFGVILITLLLDKYRTDFFLVFILSILICGTLEYLTSFYMEKIFNARWWDYHNRKFNINGRICLETLLPFGFVGSLILCYVNPFLVNIFSKLSTVFLNSVCLFLLIIYTIDCLISLFIIFSFKGETYSQKDNTEEISNKVKDKTEELLMKAESNAIVFGRKVKLGKLRFSRKVKYTRKHLSDAIVYTPKELAEMFKKSKNELEYKLSDSKDKLANQIKLRKVEIEMKQKEFTYQIKENFKNQSILRKRLMEAFPSLIVIPKINKNKKEKIKAKGEKNDR